MPASLSTAQIGRSGELLVQYTLLLRGIESAPMSTDTGVDLVAYSPVKTSPFTIQVKTNLKPKPSGGSGKDALDWWIEDTTPAQLVAFVALSSRSVWVAKASELKKLAQQHSSGRYHFYMYTDPTHQPKKRKPGSAARKATHMYSFEKYRLENRAHAIFGI